MEAICGCKKTVILFMKRVWPDEIWNNIPAAIKILMRMKLDYVRLEALNVRHIIYSNCAAKQQSPLAYSSKTKRDKLKSKSVCIKNTESQN